MQYIIAAALCAVLAGFVWLVRRPTTARTVSLAELLPGREPVPELGDWTSEALAEVACPAGHPLERDLSEIELAEPLLFDQVAAAYPVRLDWAPVGFTAEWRIFGEVAAQLGDPQPLAAVPA